MNSRSVIWTTMIIGSTFGAYLPAFWGDSVFSFSSVILSAAGGFTGIWIGYNLTH